MPTKICPRCSSRMEKEPYLEDDETQTWRCRNCGYALYQDDPDKAKGYDAREYKVRRTKYEIGRF